MIATRPATSADLEAVPPHLVAEILFDELVWTVGAAFFETDDVGATPFDAITFPLGLMWPFDTPKPTDA